MNKINPGVNKYLTDGCGRCKLYATPQCKVHSWQRELQKLRSMLLDSELTEELKWGVPCYTYNGKNVVLIGAFKEYCTLSFLKGALIKDEKGILTLPGENSQIARVFKFSAVKELVGVEKILKTYIKEAVEIEKRGEKVKTKKVNEFELPDELQQKFKEQPALQTAFRALTPGRQRGYLIYFCQPKQVKTREARIEKCIELIFKGKGLQD